MCSKTGAPQRILSILALFIWLAVPAGAQVVGASLSGTVADASGAVLPKVKVEIQNVSTGVTRSVTTDSVGLYVAPNLLPGSYQVTVTAAGFQTQVESGINLTVGAQQVLNIQMQVGTISSKVQVNAQEPTVELESSTLNAVVDSTTVRELPLNGRSWSDLATLQPGVNGETPQDVLNGGSARGSRGFANGIAISGGRPQWNNYRLDGVSINDYSNSSGSVLGGNLGVDAIQEFSVLTGNFSAAYGMSAGGVINAVTRSGANQFHGSAYEFLRNSVLDARNYFDPPTIPPFRRNQFGADGGGPIRHNKLFAFADYEGIRQAQSITSLETVPSSDARSGELCSVPSSSACSPHTVTVNSAAAAYLPFWPLPNQGLEAGANGDIGIWNVPVPQVLNENFLTARGDYKVSDKDSLDTTYMRDFARYGIPNALDSTISDNVTNRQLGTIEETHIFSPSFVNSARVGYFRNAVVWGASVTPINPLTTNKGLGAIPGQTAAAVVVTGLTTFVGGVGSTAGSLDDWNSFQEYDDAFWTRGTHSFKFGGAVDRIQDNRVALGQGGQFTFSSLQNFLTNIPSKYAIATSAATEEYGFRQTVFAVYGLDDWRIKRNLTLNLGMRYEMVTVPTEVKNRLSVLLTPTSSTPHLGSPYYANSTELDFEPHVGFAWDPMRNGKTAVRGAFGIYDVLPLPYEYVMKAAASTPFSQATAVNSPPAGSFYSGVASLLTASSADVPYIGPTHRSYAMQYNLNLQQEFPGQVTATVGYVGLRGVHLPFRDNDIDIVTPTLTSAGYVWPAPVGSGTKLNPNFGDVYGMSFNNSSDYNSLQTSVVKSMGHGVQVQGSFTWGKSFDDGSASSVGEQFMNAASSLPFYDLHRNRGLSDFNVTRTLVINGTWLIPTAKSLSGVAAHIINGWEAGTIYQASDGVPFTPEFGTGGDPLGQKDSSPLDFPNVTRGQGCQSLINKGNVTNYVKTQCFSVPTAPDQAFYNTYCDPKFGTYPECFNLMGNAGRNILTGPGLSNLSFSLYKNDKIGERVTTQFRAEFFNILNQANFSFPFTGSGDSVNTNVINANGTINPSAGLIASTTTTSRQIQFGLKIIW
jgi:Carboxypeptidase regulatory-like domain/TonB-dependent Receptor Plug Domain